MIRQVVGVRRIGGRGDAGVDVAGVKPQLVQGQGGASLHGSQVVEIRFDGHQGGPGFDLAILSDEQILRAFALDDQALLGINGLRSGGLHEQIAPTLKARNGGKPVNLGALGLDVKEQDVVGIRRVGSAPLSQPNCRRQRWNRAWSEGGCDKLHRAG